MGLNCQEKVPIMLYFTNFNVIELSIMCHVQVALSAGSQNYW